MTKSHELSRIVSGLAAGAAETNAAFWERHREDQERLRNALDAGLFGVEEEMRNHLLAAIAPPRMHLAELRADVTLVVESTREVEAGVDVELFARPVTSLLQLRHRFTKEETSRLSIVVTAPPASAEHHLTSGEDSNAIRIT